MTTCTCERQTLLFELPSRFEYHLTPQTILLLVATEWISWHVICKQLVGFDRELNSGLTGCCSASDRVGQYWVRDDVTQAGNWREIASRGGNDKVITPVGVQEGPRMALRVTRDISRNCTTTVPSIATVQYVTHVLSVQLTNTIMTKSGVMSSLRLTCSHLRRRTKINPPLTTTQTPRFLV
jgi:hypothetical protein